LTKEQKLHVIKGLLEECSSLDLLLRAYDSTWYLLPPIIMDAMDNIKSYCTSIEEAAARETIGTPNTERKEHT
jgi:hypothetical protein